MLNNDIFELYEVIIFIPYKNEYMCFSEGLGDNFTEEDAAEGYIDYIDYTKYDIDGNAIDGGDYFLKDFVVNIPWKDLIDEDVATYFYM